MSMFNKKEKLKINMIAANLLSLDILCGLLGDETCVLVGTEDVSINTKFDIFSNEKNCLDTVKFIYSCGINIQSISIEQTIYFFSWTDDDFNSISDGSKYISFENALGASLLYHELNLT